MKVMFPLRCGVLSGVRFSELGWRPPVRVTGASLAVDSGRGVCDQTSQWTETSSDSRELPHRAAVPNLFGTKDQFPEDNFSMERGGGMVSG